MARRGPDAGIRLAGACDLMQTRSVAIRGQIPLLLLMVGYTIASLWILAQPIVG